MRVLGRLVGVAASFLLCVAAQGAVAPQRILTAIDPSQVSEVQGNVPLASRGASDLGAAPADLALTEMSLRFNMTPAQETALTQLLIDQQNPASGRYQQWLTPEEFSAQFGLAPADIQKVSTWLTSQGFTVTGVARGGTFLSFTGTVAQAQAAFHTHIHRMSVNGETHFANMTDPQLPAALASVTSLITGLHDFRLRSRVREKITPAVTDVTPLYTSAASGNHFLAPADFWTIYDEANLITSGTNGSGVTVAVMGQTDINLSDIATFRSLGGLPATAPTVMLVPVGGVTKDPGTTTNDLTEAELDVEWSGATGPGATILYVNSTDVINGSLTQAIDQNLAPIISLSYGLCENLVGLSNLNFYNTLIQQASAQGQTVVSSAGDSGATDCDTGAVATAGLSVDWPAVLPGVTAIGGTTFVEGTGTFWSTTNNATNNSSVLSYIPESVWNESIADGSLSSGGGGASAYFTKPYWQVGTGVPADSARDVPDISMQAALNHDAVLICTPGFCTGGTYKNASGSHDIVGGTSVGAPSFAGLMSLVVQRVGHRVGNANPTLYALANSTYYSSVFHDVTTGDNKSPCTAGSTNCPAGGNIGFAAGVGYDLATGWGSLDVFNLVNDWSLVTPLTSPIGLAVSTTTLTGTPSAVVQGTNIAFTSTTSGASGTPTGTVQFLLDNVKQGSAVAINASGVATFSLTTTSIPNGAHTVQAAYSGNATYAGSKGSFAIIITSSGVPDFSIAPATSTVTIAGGGTGTVALTVNGLNSFTGSVTLSASSVTNEGSSFSVNPVSLTNTKTAGFTTLTIFAYKTNAVSGQSAKAQTPAMPWSMKGTGVALAGILFLVLPKRRRFVGALAAVLSIGIFAVSGCGAGGTTQLVQSTNTAPGTYTITVTGNGTSGTTTATHTATVTLIVQ